MPSINRGYDEKMGVESKDFIAVPPLPVLLELAGLVLALAWETAKRSFLACLAPDSRYYFSNPRAGAAMMLRAFAERINKE